MTTALSLLNAVALITLLVLHMQNDSDQAVSPISSNGAVYSQVVRAVPPQVAHFENRESAAVLANDSDDAPIPVERTERWIF